MEKKQTIEKLRKAKAYEYNLEVFLEILVIWEFLEKSYVIL